MTPANGQPRDRFRIVLQPAGLRKPDLENSTCRRTLWPNGTVSEMVCLGTSSNGRELTDAELDEWVTSFPIEAAPTRVKQLTIMRHNNASRDLRVTCLGRLTVLSRQSYPCLPVWHRQNGQTESGRASNRLRQHLTVLLALSLVEMSFLLLSQACRAEIR